MAVTMMQVGIMRVAVPGRIVPMCMGMRLRGAGLVQMPVVRVMSVTMRVFQRFVPVPVRVHFENMEQHA